MQRKGNAASNYPSNIDTIYTKVVEEASKMMKLLVTWESKHSKKPIVNVMFIEYESVVNEDKLMQLYDKINSISLDCKTFRRLICSRKILTVAYNVVRNNFELKIIISERFKNLKTMKSIWIDPKR
jgi:hypothetical protein